MSDIEEKLTTISDNVQRVYDAGKKAEYDAFWDDYQNFGTTTSYRAMFSGLGWTDETFKPKYPIKPTSILMMFVYTRITDLEKAFKKAGVQFDTSASTNCTQAFASSRLTVVPPIDIRSCTESGGHMKQMFTGCQYLRTIRELRFRDDGSTIFTVNDFTSCKSLEDLTIVGKIGQNNFNVSDCTNLTHDSLMSIINALQDKTGVSGTWKITIGSTNKIKLAREELQIAYDRNWEVA